MPWFKVDDKLHDHRKARAAGVSAMGLWTLAGSWAADNVTDGFVPDSVCSRWDRSYRKLADALVAAGLWYVGELDGEAGWWFHDWKEMQPSRAEVLTKRAEARDRMARLRANRGGSSREQTANVQENESRSSEEVRSTPTRPDPEGSKEPSKPRKRGTRIDPDWKPTEADVAWQRDQGISDLLARREFPKFIDYWLAKSGPNGAKLDWSATWRNWLRTAQERTPNSPPKQQRDPGWEYGMGD